MHIKQNPEDVFARFTALPEDLEVIIENKKAGVPNPEDAEWDSYDLEVLERGFYLIKRKKLLAFGKHAGECLVFLLFMLFEAHEVAADLRHDSPALLSAIIVNIRLIALGMVPILIFVEMIHGGESSILPAEEKDVPDHVRIFKRSIKIMLGLIILLDLINSLVGAL